MKIVRNVTGMAGTEAPVLRKTLWGSIEPVVAHILAMSLFDETGSYAENVLHARPAKEHYGALRHPYGATAPCMNTY